MSRNRKKIATVTRKTVGISCSDLLAMYLVIRLLAAPAGGQETCCCRQERQGISHLGADRCPALTLFFQPDEAQVDFFCREHVETLDFVLYGCGLLGVEQEHERGILIGQLLDLIVRLPPRLSIG